MKKQTYKYNSVQTENLEILGSQNIIAKISAKDALSLIQQLAIAIQDPSEDGTIRFGFDMREPESKNEVPTLSLSFGHLGWIEPELHWALIEGHLIYSLDHDEE